MKLSKLYQNRKYGFPMVIAVFIVTCTVVTIPTYFNCGLYEIFATWTKPRYFWQYFSGTFEHSIFFSTGRATWFIWIHFGTNLSIILLFGLMIEKIIGSNKLLLISFVAMIVSETIFEVNNRNIQISCTGASGVAYAYVPIALYMIIKVFLLDKKAVWKQLLWYVYLIELFVIWIIISLLSTWKGSNSCHFTATIIGLIFLLVYKKKIDKEFAEYHIGTNSENIKKSKVLWLLWLLPLFMIGVIVLYFKGIITTYYTW